MKLNKITWDDILGKICNCFYKKCHIIIQNNYVTIRDLNETYKTSLIISNNDSIKNIKDRIKGIIKDII